MRNNSPRSILQAESPIVRTQTESAPFRAGMWGDIPASSVPRNGVAHSIGYMLHPDRAQPVAGCKRYSDEVLPELSGRTGYALTKSGTTVTKTVGTDFTIADVGNFVVFDDGAHERISAYIDADNVTVEGSTAHDASIAAYLRGPVHFNYPHTSQQRVLLHIDSRLFVSDISITSWVECKCISYKTLSDSDSNISALGDNAVLVCANGTFMINLDQTDVVYWLASSPIPTVLITDVDKTLTKPYGRRYTYCMSRITGDDADRDRNTSGSQIEHITGSCKVNSDYRDYGTVYTTRPAGTGSTTYAVLTGAALVSPYDVATGWSSITNGQFSIELNGTARNCSVDFTGVSTMSEVARRIQNSLRSFVKTALCEFEADHIVITLPDEGSTVSVTSAGAGGTDIGATSMKCQDTVGTVTTPTYTAPSTIGLLTVPTDPVTATAYQYHDTHYSLFASMDVGANGIDPITGEANKEDLLVWAADVPVAKAFVASRTGDVVTATVGVFQKMDEGCKLRFQDNTEITLLAYTSATEMTSTTSGAIASQSAAIGGDNAVSKPIRIMTASQTGTTVTRTGGVTFSASDVRKTIYWANGLRSHIVSITDNNTAETVEDQTIASTAACMDPMCRNFTDTITDDQLRSRVSGFPLRMRFWEPLPASDSGLIVAGMLFTIVREEKKLYYGQVPTGYHYMCGYHSPDIQVHDLNDDTLTLSEHLDDLIIYCKNTTHAVSINTFDTESVPQVGETVIIITGSRVISHNIGARDYGAVCKLDQGADWVMTNEPGIRIFDGRKYSENLAEGRVSKLIERLKSPIACQYDPFNGVTFWGLDE